MPSCPRKLLILICLLTNCFILSQTLRAESLSSDIIKTDQTEIRLFSAVTGTAGKNLPLGLDMRLRPDWKTYWRSPGDAGFPLMLNVLNTKNLGKLHLQWPVPHRFELFGLQTFGYSDRVVFPIDFDILDPNRPAALVLQARYLICKDVCIPYEAELSLDIPAGAAAPTDDAALLAEYLARVPADHTGLVVQSAHWDGKDRLVLFVRDEKNETKELDLFLEGPNGYFFSPTSVNKERGLVRLETKIERNDSAPLFDGTSLMATIAGPSRGVEFAIPDLAKLPALPDAPSLTWIILAVAFLGGVILNVMPCVLPVLVLKLTAILDSAAQEKHLTRFSFLASAVGIVFSFLVLAGFLVGLKAGGYQIGWGIQFQNIYFLGFLAGVCLLFAANLVGIFSIPVPTFAGSVFADDGKKGWSRPFLTGCFATLLATPCSAPFVGTAVGFALAGSTLDILAIFLFMGFGLALPYLAVAAFPASVRLLPKPGKWMSGIKWVLAASLAATAIWLGAIMLNFGNNVTVAQVEPGKITWQAFDEERITAEVARGNLVFVDVTADWCLTCLANERLVLGQERIRLQLNAPQVVAMRADWTRPDGRISSYLARHGRYGIPFNIVYGPSAKSGIILPELLTAERILDAIREAR